MRTSPVAVAVAASLGLAAAAPAQTFTPRIGFRADHTFSGTPTVSEIVPSGAGAIPLSVLFGAFDAQGFTNRGMFNFIATITVTDPANQTTIAYRTGTPGSGLRSPYNFGGIENLSPDGLTLSFDANRGAAQVNDLTWNVGDPPPAETYVYPPNGGGPDSYFPGERILVGGFDATVARDILVTVTGELQAITGWFAVSSTPPEDEFTPGSQDLLPAGFVSASVTATFVIHIPIPAASSAATLALGGLVAARRRR